jgi:AraC-like DNA-binding protein
MNDRLARYRVVHFGVETLDSALVLPRHRHAAGYANVVLAGSFEEASFAGRFVASPGDVLLHAPFDCHANWAVNRRALQILRLPWFNSSLEGRFRIPDPDELVRLAERDLIDAVTQLQNGLIPIPPQELHWTERLAQALRFEKVPRLEAWADAEHLTPETISRGFHRAFGVTPRVFRIESRARRAWNLLLRSPSPLTAIAHELGFADQAHLSRTISALTGAAPTYWRRHGVSDGLARQACSHEMAAPIATAGYDSVGRRQRQ